MKIPASKVALLFGLVLAVSLTHLGLAVSEQGATWEAIAPPLIGLFLLLALVSAMLYHFSRPVEGVDGQSPEAWAVRARPIFKWLVPVFLLTHVGLLLRLVLG